MLDGAFDGVLEGTRVDNVDGTLDGVIVGADDEVGEVEGLNVVLDGADDDKFVDDTEGLIDDDNEGKEDETFEG